MSGSQRVSDYTQEEQTEAYKRVVKVRIYTLAQIIKIIDAAQSRGAFKASEMTFVGSIYDSIFKGVSSAMQDAREDLAELNESVEQETVRQPQVVQSQPQVVQQSQPQVVQQSQPQIVQQSQTQVVQQSQPQVVQQSQPQIVQTPPPLIPQHPQMQPPQSQPQVVQQSQQTEIPQPTNQSLQIPEYNPDVPGVNIPPPQENTNLQYNPVIDVNHDPQQTHINQVQIQKPEPVEYVLEDISDEE